MTIVTEYDVLSNESFFFASQKGGKLFKSIASVNYLKVKNDISYWNMIVPDRNQIHGTPNFSFSSS